MSHAPDFSAAHESDCSELSKLVFPLPSGRRGAVLQSVVSFRPELTVERSFEVGRFRAAFADYWEATFAQAVPVRELRAVLDPPVPIRTVLEFSRLTISRSHEETSQALQSIVVHLNQRIREEWPSAQRRLFDAALMVSPANSNRIKPPAGESVASLKALVDQGRRFPTVYADPPWAYDNEASRGAAVNHYPTMSVQEICSEPVRDLSEENAHLHLWTTNGFLREAFGVIEAWGFEFKSCLIWVKDEIGMGNYWRVSHEFLLLGVRGSLKFRDRAVQSWLQSPRTIHSRKPRVVRALVERVSPGPYLELYGREELPDSAWTVYGNQVEKRLF